MAARWTSWCVFSGLKNGKADLLFLGLTRGTSKPKIQDGRHVTSLDFVFWTDWGKLISLFTCIDPFNLLDPLLYILN
jgi:hypothetical protein